MKTFYVGPPLSRDSLFNKTMTNNQNLHDKYFCSLNLMNNSFNTFNKNLNKSHLIFKKKNLKNSFSLSRKNKKKKNIVTNIDNISIIEGINFQIIPNLKKKIIKRKTNALNIKERQKNSEDEKEFTFHNLTEIRQKEIPKIEVKFNNDIQQRNKKNKKLNIKELLDLIIKIKNKHKAIRKTDYIKNITKTEKLKSLKKEINEIKIKLPNNQENINKY